MGNGSVSLKLHFLSEEPPVVCLAGEARSRGRWAREGIRVCRVGLDSQMWSLGLASVCVSQCRGLTGHDTSYTPPPPQGPRSGPGVLSPMGEGSRPDRSGGWGSHLSFLVPPPPVHLGGGGRSWEVGTGFRLEGAICSDNWCWAAFTQQPVCLGRQYLENIVWKLGPAWGMGVLQGILRLAQTLPQACWQSSLPFFALCRQSWKFSWQEVLLYV